MTSGVMGKFEFPNLDRGDYHLTIRRDGFAKVDNNAVMYDPDFLRNYEFAAQTVEVLPGSKRSVDLKLTLN